MEGFSDFQNGAWVGLPFGVRMGRLVGKELESRHLASYNIDDGLWVIRARVGGPKVLAHGQYGEPR
jgi:hypothetical protein